MRKRTEPREAATGTKHRTTQKDRIMTPIAWDHLAERDSIESLTKDSSATHLTDPGSVSRGTDWGETHDLLLPIWFFWRVINCMRSTCHHTHYNIRSWGPHALSLDALITEPQWTQSNGNDGNMAPDNSVGKSIWCFFTQILRSFTTHGLLAKNAHNIIIPKPSSRLISIQLYW